MIIVRVLGPGMMLLRAHRRSCLIVQCRCGHIGSLYAGLVSQHKVCCCPPQERETIDGVERRCKQCGDWWFLTQYHVHTSSPSKRRSVCPACVSERRPIRRTGRKNIGSQHGRSRLTEDDVLEIRRVYGKLSSYQLGERFDVDPSTVHKAATRKSWRHL